MRTESEREEECWKEFGDGHGKHPVLEERILQMDSTINKIYQPSFYISGMRVYQAHPWFGKVMRWWVRHEPDMTACMRIAAVCSLVTPMTYYNDGLMPSMSTNR